MLSSKINKVEKIDDDLYVITETESVHCYLILGKDKAVLFDIGYGYEDIQYLVRQITDLPLMLVISHGDPDHGLGCAHFSDVWLHELDYSKLIWNDTLEMKKTSLQYRLKKMPELTDEIDEESYYQAHILNHTMPHFLKDKDCIDLGGKTLEVIHTPGHSYGHIMLLDKDKKRLFSGDQITKHNIWYFSTSDQQAPFAIAKHSLEKIMKRKDDFTDIYSAHDVFPINYDNVIEQIECFTYELKENYHKDTYFESFIGLNGYQHIYKSVNLIYNDQRLGELLEEEIKR